jgi:dynein heavy chain
VFKLGHLLGANLLAKREAVEDLASAALKEEAIERKLAGIAADWGDMTLTFQDYKSRGPVVLKARRSTYA